MSRTRPDGTRTVGARGLHDTDANGERLEGAKSFDKMEQKIKSLLKK
jgi:hypothetical protein